MPESTGDLIAIALALIVVWFLGGSFASGEHRGPHGGAPESERSSRHGGAHRW
jgi:hypothetical protein